MANKDQIILQLGYGTLVIYPQEVFELVRESPSLLAAALRRGIREKEEILKRSRRSTGEGMEATVMNDWGSLIWIDFADGKWLVSRRNDDGTHAILKRFDKPLLAFESACNMRDGVQIVCPNGDFKPSAVNDICRTKSAADEIDRMMGGPGWLENANEFHEVQKTRVMGVRNDE